MDAAIKEAYNTYKRELRKENYEKTREYEKKYYAEHKEDYKRRSDEQWLQKKAKKETK